jgi:hypothetical protein
MKDPRPGLRSYPLFDALRFRRSRRFGLGMHLEYGPMSHQSAHAPMPLSEEEAYLAFAGCGITGRAMMELEYSQGRGGSMIGGYLARTKTPHAHCRVPPQGRNPPVPFAIGLEKDAKPLLEPYCPPYYPSMKDAVMAFLERKFGSQGLFREGIKQSQYKDPATLGSAAKPQRPHAIEATIAYCEYVQETCGRFPGCTAPFRTSVGFQSVHLDLEFYEKFYRPEAVSELEKGTPRELAREPRFVNQGSQHEG